MPRIGLSYNQTLPEAVTHLPHLLGQKPLHLFLLREFKLVFGDEEVVIHAGKGIFHQGVVFLRAKQNAHGWIVAVGCHVLLVPAHIGVELADVFRG